MARKGKPPELDVAKGYVGLTYPEWYSFLSTQLRIDEVNLWRPRAATAFRALRRGEPFFFKLLTPYRDIAGFGFFERFESRPAWAGLGLLWPDERSS